MPQSPPSADESDATPPIITSGAPAAVVSAFRCIAGVSGSDHAAARCRNSLILRADTTPLPGPPLEEVLNLTRRLNARSAETERLAGELRSHPALRIFSNGSSVVSQVSGRFS